MATVLFCTTDAGGARNLAPVVSAAVADGVEIVVATTAGLNHLFAGVDAQTALIGPAPDPSAVVSLMDRYAPRAVICGTTRYLSPERLLVAAAREVGVPSVVVLDEWFNYRMRFEGPDGALVLPDRIAAQDEQAKREAHAEGLPLEIIEVTGSPALAELSAEAERFCEAPPPAPEILTAHQGVPVITFLSETHAADYGQAHDEPGPLGPFLGYTEDTVFAELLRVVESLGVPCVVVDKLHPAAEVPDGVSLSDGGVPVVRTRTAPLWPLIWHSDAVVGMRSMALLETSILGAPAISFQPGLIVPEQGTAVRLGLVECTGDPERLSHWLGERLADTGRHSVCRHGFAPKDAAASVLSLALEGVAS